MEEERAERMENLLKEIEGCTDEELARLECIIMERKRRAAGRAAAPSIAAPLGTALAQLSNPRPRCSGLLFDVHYHESYWLGYSSDLSTFGRYNEQRQLLN